MGSVTQSEAEISPPKFCAPFRGKRGSKKGVPQLGFWAPFFGVSTTHKLPENVLKPSVEFSSQSVMIYGRCDPNYKMRHDISLGAAILYCGM